MLARPRLLVMISALALTLTGCMSSNDKPAPTKPPTHAAGPVDPGRSSTPTPISPAAPTIAALSTGNSFPVGDGTCQARVPFGWIDNGNGSGTTPSGAAWTVFGNRLAAAEDWMQAVALLKPSAAAQPGARITQGADFVHVAYASDRGFAHRDRFADRYCDVRVSSANAPIPAPERACWDAIVRSLGPAA